MEKMLKKYKNNKEILQPQDINDAIKMEQSVKTTVEKLINSIYQKILTTPYISQAQSRNNCFCISFNAIKDNNLVLSPSYYCPQKQADTIRKKLMRTQNITELINKIRIMIQEKRVKISHNNIVKLNPQTVNILQSVINDIEGCEKCV